MMPEITVNGVKMTGRDYLAVAGIGVVLAGLLMAGLPWALIGVGSAVFAASRIRWVS
jgi:NAD(P)H-hydrate repair Nnr-like enzyme with NAD(P)H-hydrate dehydratase domain